MCCVWIRSVPHRPSAIETGTATCATLPTQGIVPTFPVQVQLGTQNLCWTLTSMPRPGSAYYGRSGQCLAQARTGTGEKFDIVFPCYRALQDCGSLDVGPRGRHRRAAALVSRLPCTAEVGFKLQHLNPAMQKCRRQKGRGRGGRGKVGERKKA